MLTEEDHIDLSKDFRIEPNGDIHTIKPAKKHYSLDELQQGVKGYIETVPCPFSRKHMGIANEEGLLLGMEYNVLASRLFERPLVGPVLVVSNDRME